MNPISSVMNYSQQVNNPFRKPFINEDNVLCLLSKVNKADEQVIKECRVLCEQFHLDDFINKAMEKIQLRFNQENFDLQLKNFKIQLKEKMDEYINKLANGANNLIVIHCKGDVVAGLFYELENNGEVLWIQGFGFDRFDQDYQLFYSLKILDCFSEKVNFPNLQTITIMVGKTSSEKKIFEKAGFEINEKYHRADYDISLFDALVKIM